MVSEACDSAFGETETVHLFFKKKGVVQEQGYLAMSPEPPDCSPSLDSLWENVT